LGRPIVTNWDFAKRLFPNYFGKDFLSLSHSKDDIGTGTVAYLGFCEGQGTERRRREVGGAGGAMGYPLPTGGVWAGCCAPPHIFFYFWFKMGHFLL